MLRTTDGAATWHDVTPPQLSALITPANVGAGAATPQVLFLDAARAWTAAAGALIATSDGGRRWHGLGALPPSCVPFEFLDPAYGWCNAAAVVAGQSVNLYRTVDGGLHWQQVPVTRRPTAWAAASAAQGWEPTINFTSPTVGWAELNCNASFNNEIYKTTDSGASWSAQPLTSMPPSLATAEIIASPPVVAGHLGAGSLSVNTGITVMYRSRNAGASWQAIVPPGGLQPWHADVIDPLHWRLADDRHILATDDGGETWQTITPHWPIRPANPDNNLPDIHFVTPDIGWAQFYDPATNTTALLRTTDAGATWTKVQSPT